MICRLLRINNERDWLESSQWLRDRQKPDPAVESDTRAILDNVRVRGDAALLDYSRKFDCPDLEPPLRISPHEIARAAATVPVESRECIAEAAANIRAFHEAEVEKSWFITRPDGTILGQRVTPVDSVGLYVPGGKGGETPLISSLLMNAIPAQVAGCRRIAVATPPRADGTVNPCLLAAAHLLDIEEVYRVGGAWSVAAFAFGTASITPVDTIAGPGNIYVTTAKKLLQGMVGIDMIAGPSEVLIMADSSANPAWVAADMLAQAEHDALACAICIVDDPRLADQIHVELEKQRHTLPRANIASQSLENWGCLIVTPGMMTGVEIANHVAPEHLELCVRDPWALMPHIRHAGAVFMGQHSPEPLGDYFAGPNHVLPTLGSARFTSGLSVANFSKKTSIISASPAFLQEASVSVAALARLEGLEAHARSVESRQKSRNPRQNQSRAN